MTIITYNYKNATAIFETGCYQSCCVVFKPFK
jgi:hypothetical protein